MTQPVQTAPQSPLRGIMLKCLSVVVFTVMGAIAKATSEGGLGVPPGQQVFFRSLFAIPVILTWLALRRELGVGLRTHRPMGHFYLGIIGTASMGLGFWALALLPFPEVTALGYAAPLLVVTAEATSEDRPSGSRTVVTIVSDGSAELAYRSGARHRAGGGTGRHPGRTGFAP